MALALLLAHEACELLDLGGFGPGSIGRLISEIGELAGGMTLIEFTTFSSRGGQTLNLCMVPSAGIYLELGISRWPASPTPRPVPGPITVLHLPCASQAAGLEGVVEGLGILLSVHSREIHHLDLSNFP